jgi:hypothetical protein
MTGRKSAQLLVLAVPLARLVRAVASGEWYGKVPPLLYDKTEAETGKHSCSDGLRPAGRP